MTAHHPTNQPIRLQSCRLSYSRLSSRPCSPLVLRDASHTAPNASAALSAARTPRCVMRAPLLFERYKLIFILIFHYQLETQIILGYLIINFSCEIITYLINLLQFRNWIICIKYDRLCTDGCRKLWSYPLWFPTRRMMYNNLLIEWQLYLSQTWDAKYTGYEGTLGTCDGDRRAASRRAQQMLVI